LNILRAARRDHKKGGIIKVEEKIKNNLLVLISIVASFVVGVAHGVAIEHAYKATDNEERPAYSGTVRDELPTTSCGEDFVVYNDVGFSSIPHCVPQNDVLKAILNHLGLEVEYHPAETIRERIVLKKKE